MTKQTTLVWFRQDLRTLDNPALFEAAKNGKILPVFILDNASAGQFKPGAASKWWLNHSLSSLNRDLEGKLNFYVGNAEEILLKNEKCQTCP